MKPSFNEILDNVVQSAKKNAIEHEQMTPFLFAIGTEQMAMIPIFEMPSEREEKDEMFEKIGHEIANQKGKIGTLQAVIFATEAWMSSVPKTEKILPRPSLDPKRKEIITIIALDLNNNMTSEIIYEIKREKGKKTELTEVMDNRKNPDNIKNFESPLFISLMKGYITVGLQQTSKNKVIN
mgnify:CR=1 FL=1